MVTKGSSNSVFHLSLGVLSISDSERFFVDVLGASVTHRDPGGYINIDFYGSQITLKQVTSLDTMPPDLHFGVNLSLEDFESRAESIVRSGYKVLMPPSTVDANTPLERKKMYLRCPSGYLIEIKGYRAP